MWAYAIETQSVKGESGCLVQFHDCLTGVFMPLLS